MESTIFDQLNQKIEAVDMEEEKGSPPQIAALKELETFFRENRTMIDQELPRLRAPQTLPTANAAEQEQQPAQTESIPAVVNPTSVRPTEGTLPNLSTAIDKQASEDTGANVRTALTSAPAAEQKSVANQSNPIVIKSTTNASVHPTGEDVAVGTPTQRARAFSADVLQAAQKNAAVWSHAKGTEEAITNQVESPNLTATGENAQFHPPVGSNSNKL